MAAKKNFDAVNTDKQATGTQTGEVFAAVEKGKNSFQRQPTASLHEKTERQEEMRTRGRKGCTASRINLCMTPTNLEYVKIMSKVTGVSMAKFINDALTEYREMHSDVYEAARKVIAMIDGADQEEGQE